MHLWCQLIPQACLVFNLLQKSIINPKNSAYAQVHGAYDFNATDAAPPGTHVVVHKKPAVCGSWEIQRIDGWYMVHALHHYRCFEVFANNTALIRIADTVDSFPHHFTIPFQSSVDNAIEVAKQLAHALQNTYPRAPLLQLEDSTMANIKKTISCIEEINICRHGPELGVPVWDNSIDQKFVR